MRKFNIIFIICIFLLILIAKAVFVSLESSAAAALSSDEMRITIFITMAAAMPIMHETLTDPLSLYLERAERQRPVSALGLLPARLRTDANCNVTVGGRHLCRIVTDMIVYILIMIMM